MKDNKQQPHPTPRVVKTLAVALRELKEDNCNVTVIDLGKLGYSSTQKIDDRGLQDLAPLLANNQSVIHLNLSGNKLSKEGVLSLARALKTNQSLISLDLSRNDIDGQGIAAIADAVKAHKTLRFLNLATNNYIRDNEGAQALAMLLETNRLLVSLDFSCNRVSKEGAQKLVQALTANHSLKSLSLSQCSIDEQGIKEFAKMLEVNTSLKSLNLNVNRVGDKGAEALAAAMKINQSLASLHIADSKVGNPGATALAAALKTNRSLVYLDLSAGMAAEYGEKIPLDSQGVQALMQAIADNRTIMTMPIENRTREQTSTINQYLDRNKAGYKKLLTLAGQGLLKEMQSIISQGTPIYADDQRSSLNKTTVLHVAITGKQNKVISWLLSQSSSSTLSQLLSAQDKDGNTPLHMAIQQNDSTTVQLLLKAGADLSCFNKAYITPKMSACQVGVKLPITTTTSTSNASSASSQLRLAPTSPQAKVLSPKPAPLLSPTKCVAIRAARLATKGKGINETKRQALVAQIKRLLEFSGKMTSLKGGDHVHARKLFGVALGEELGHYIESGSLPLEDELIIEEILLYQQQKSLARLHQGSVAPTTGISAQSLFRTVSKGKAPEPSSDSVLTVEREGNRETSSLPSPSK